MGRDVPRSDATRQLWRAAEGSGREHGEHGEDPPLPAASTVAPLRQGQAELSTAQSSISS